MFDQKKVKELVLTSLVADAYSLGAHWVYDEKQLASETIDWNELNTPLAIWHKGKQAGDFTHYGDQTYWLYEFLKDKDSFNENEFLNFWASRMNLYGGYIDGASRNTLKNLEDGVSPVGSDSTDLSVVGRIAPLLKVSNSKERFLENVEKFTNLTHNSQKSLTASKFFAKLLWEALNGNDIEETILDLKDEFDTAIQEHIEQGINSKTKDTFESIRAFGPACDVDEGFTGVIHLLCKYDNLKDMLICNAKAGGDSSARAMIASIILMANKPISQIPQNWLSIKDWAAAREFQLMFGKGTVDQNDNVYLKDMKGRDIYAGDGLMNIGDGSLRFPYHKMTELLIENLFTNIQIMSSGDGVQEVAAIGGRAFMSDFNKLMRRIAGDLNNGLVEGSGADKGINATYKYYEFNGVRVYPVHHKWFDDPSRPQLLTRDGRKAESRRAIFTSLGMTDLGTNNIELLTLGDRAFKSGSIPGINRGAEMKTSVDGEHHHVLSETGIKCANMFGVAELFVPVQL